MSVTNLLSPAKMMPVVPANVVCGNAVFHGMCSPSYQFRMPLYVQLGHPKAYVKSCAKNSDIEAFQALQLFQFVWWPMIVSIAETRAFPAGSGKALVCSSIAV